METVYTVPGWCIAVLCCAVVVGLSKLALPATLGSTTHGQLRVLFMVQGPDRQPSQVVENTLAQAFLRRGYGVIDAATVSQALRRHAYLLTQVELEAAKRLGSTLEADIVVSGEAKSRVVDKTYILLEGKKVLISQGNVSIKAVLAKNGRVIAAETGSARKPFDTTGEISLQMAAEATAGRLLQRLEEFLQRDTVDYRLGVLNINASQSLTLQEGLRHRLQGIRRVDEQGLTQHGLEFNVIVQKDQDLSFKQSLFAQLSRLGLGTLEVVAGEGQTMYLRPASDAIAAQPKPDALTAPVPSSGGTPTAPGSHDTASRQPPPGSTPGASSPALPPGGTAQYKPGYRKSWAVLIGINEYQQWPKLQYAVNDARAIETLVRGLGFDEVITVLDREATQQRILRVLGDDLYAKTQDDDRVFIFFAGHGQTQDLPNAGKDGYIIPVDGDLKNYYSTAISMQQLQRLADRIRAKHMFYAMDACFSGLLLRFRGEALDDPPAGLTTAQARQVLTAGSEGEKVVESGGHGLFTKSLMSGLVGAADLNQDGYITATELYQYITPQVLEGSRNSQNPVFGRLGHGQGEFVFVRK